MIPIEVAFENDGYDTAEAAVAAVKNDPWQPSARRDAEAFAGQRFVDAWGDPAGWVLEFSRDLWLRVFIDGGRVTWVIERRKPDKPPVADPSVLKWRRGNTTRVDPAVLAADRRGAVFWQFWVKNMGFHVYLRGKLILFF